MRYATPMLRPRNQRAGGGIARRRHALFTLAAFCDKPAVRDTEVTHARRRRMNKADKGWHWVRVLLLLPFLGVLSVPVYNSVEPTLFAVPFFYWYQMLWIVICAVIVSIVYLVEH
jgi:hypothetical protein